MRVKLSFAALATLLVLVATSAAPVLAADTLVFVDPGHGGRYSGATYGVREADVNLWIGLELRAELRALGYDMTMSRTSDITVGGGVARPAWHWDDDGVHFRMCDASCSHDAPISDLQVRCDMANQAGADIFISIHNNAAGSSARGTETYHNWDNKTDTILSRRLAEEVQEEVVDSVGTVDRGVHDVGFYVVRWSNMPAILVEVGFLSNATDRALLLSPSFRRSVARGIAQGVHDFMASDPFSELEPRIWGADRYETAAEIAREGWKDGADAVLLASGENWPDALAATPLSAKLDAPVLLTRAGGLPNATAIAIREMGPEEIVVLGGVGAISQEAAAQAERAANKGRSGPIDVRRIAGDDRYHTAGLIAQEVGVPADGRVFLCSGEAYPDALSIGSYAGTVGSPILMTRSTFLSPETDGFLDGEVLEVSATAMGGATDSVEPTGSVEPTDTPEPPEPPGQRDVEGVVVVGGAGVVSDDIKNQLDARFTTSRIWGWDRYETNLAVLETYWPETDGDPLVATAQDYPDALVAGCLASKRGEPVVLVGRKYLHARTRELIMNEGERFTGFTMIGGDGAVGHVMDWELLKARR